MKKFKSLVVAVLSIVLCFSGIALADATNVSKVDYLSSVLNLGKIDVDVKEDASYIKSAFSNKILTGDMKAFKKDGYFSNQEAVVMAIRALGEDALAKKLNDETLLNSFVDKKNISPWAKPYVEYALKNKLIDDTFKPQDNINQEVSKTILDKSKLLYDTQLTREGLTAINMIDASNKNMVELKTYKFQTVMSGGTDARTPQGMEHMDINMIQDGVVASPESMYMKQTMTIKDKKTGQETKIVMDTIVKGKTMYIKEENGVKWTKMDLDPMMQDLQGLTDGKMSSPTITKQQLELFGMYATYEKDVTIDGKDYYVISMNIDKDAFKNAMSKIMESSAKISANNMKIKDSSVKVDANELQKAMGSMFDNMNITLNMKLHIEKYSKTYNKTDMDMAMKMNIAPVNIDMTMKGEVKMFDLGKEVTVPEIKDTDIQTMEEMMKSVPSVPVQVPEK